MGTADDMERLMGPELLDFIKAYFMDSHPKTDIRLVANDKELIWMVHTEGRPKVIDQPLEFFINAQIHPTQSIEFLIEQICHTLEDICRSWAIGSDSCKHYVTFRVPQKVMVAPTGTTQLTLIVSVFTDPKSRELFLKV